MLAVGLEVLERVMFRFASMSIAQACREKLLWLLRAACEWAWTSSCAARSLVRIVALWPLA